MTLKKVSRLMPIDPPSKEHTPKRPPFTFTEVDIDDISTYPPEGAALFFVLKEGAWDRFYGERRGFTVFSDLYGLTFKLDQIRAWSPAGFTSSESYQRELRKIRG
ncbi:hypothetical protein [Sutterella wadsworthensis]|uniref:hypothetical protein n=1 Tax=Sutterella wadsworthensis TaxID=40545 RepID=UPI003AF06922